MMAKVEYSEGAAKKSLVLVEKRAPELPAPGVGTAGDSASIPNCPAKSWVPMLQRRWSEIL